MRITIVRRIAQGFFFALFLWFCICATQGQSFWRLRGWPVNWFLQLDPLVALSTALTTKTLYAGLIWAVATIGLTAVLGRFFCGWVCPFGALHHLFGWIGSHARTVREKIALNQYNKNQRIKYYVLLALLVPTFAGSFLKLDGVASSTLLGGFLDPIPLLYRSINFLILPLADSSAHFVFAAQRHYDLAWLTALVFFSAILLNLAIPRFYCRFVCPLGALFGLIGRYSLWRIGKKEAECSRCGICSARCEGACDPQGSIRISECLLCMNCLDTCKDNLPGYSTSRSAGGEIVSPDLSKRGFVTTALCAAAAVPLLRLDGRLGKNYDAALIRPPGSLAEPDFLDRCLRCGQCARVCPTNVIEPDGFRDGIEGLWTPRLNMRAGTSGCQKNCTLCGHICPTAAIRPLSLDEKLGLGKFRKAGPIRIGTAFVDRGRCLPWAMNKPCIVCQENCPVSPKAIYVKESYALVRDGVLEVANVSGTTVSVVKPALKAHHFDTGDYFLSLVAGGVSEKRRILSNSKDSFTLESALSQDRASAPGGKFLLLIRLQAPVVDPERCVGCGVCEHECPVSGQRAIRVSAEGESRSRKHSLLLD